MAFARKWVLYLLLMLLGVSLLFPGLAEVLTLTTAVGWLHTDDIDAKNQLRALNAMMAALGAVALLACWRLQRNRQLVQALGLCLAFVVLARIYSLFVDGMPSLTHLIYLGVEGIMAAVFLIWPPTDH